MDKLYRVVFLGLLETEEIFKDQISHLGISSDIADKIIKKAPVILKEADSLEYIKKYASAVKKAGGNVNISSSNTDPVESDFIIPGMSSFTQCSRCGHRQPKKERCEKCGNGLNGIIDG